MDKLIIKENIRKAREELNISQKDMADKMGISRTAYWDFESGKTRIFSRHVSEFARLAGKSEEEIVLGYSPSRAGEKELHEIGSLKSRLGQIVEDYEKRLEELRFANDNLQSLVSSQKQTIKTQEDMINMLLRQIGKLEKESGA